jgi:hypothetical protein
MIALLAYGFGEDDDGMPFITGPGPDDPARRAQLKESGWQEYSINVGGNRVSYLPSPMAIPMAIVGRIVDGYKYNKYSEETASTVMLRGTIGGASTIFDMSFLSGLKSLFGILGDSGEKKAERFAANVVGSTLMPNLVRQFDRTIDPKSYEGEGFLGNLAASVPGVRQNMQERITPTANPIENQPISRFLRLDPNREVMDVLNSRGIVIRPPGTETRIRGQVATKEQLREIIVLSGPRITARLQAALPAIRALPEEQAEALVRRITQEERAAAKARVEAQARSVPTLPDL